MIYVSTFFGIIAVIAFLIFIVLSIHHAIMCRKENQQLMEVRDKYPEQWEEAIKGLEEHQP